jgi:multisubunit Na+/H+ antiporter MnhC subunit
VLLVVLVLLGAYLTSRMRIVTVVQLLMALDAGVLVYWFYVRPRREVAPGRPVPRTSMRSLAEVIRMAGVLLILNALWITILGVLTQFGITHETMADWRALAASGFQVRPDQPVWFGARGLVVAAAVWVVGFGLAKASGEKA